MSEEERITKVETEKDPKRVAAGKKLAEYNRVRREKKQVDEDEREDNGGDGGTNCAMVILTGVGIITGLGCLYLKYRQNKREETKQQQQKQPPPSRPPPQKPKNNKLRSLDD